MQKPLFLQGLLT